MERYARGAFPYGRRTGQAHSVRPRHHHRQGLGAPGSHPQPPALQPRGPRIPRLRYRPTAPATAYLATVHGTSLVSDRVYPDRFTHAGADVTLKDRTLIIQGRPLTGAAVEACDIRAGGGLIIAALAAEGESHIAGLQYIERGYDDIANRLRSLGAQVGVQHPELALAAD